MIEKKTIIAGTLLVLVIIGILSLSLFVHGVFGKTLLHAEFYADQNPTAAPILFIGLSAVSVVAGPLTSFFLIPPSVAIWGSAITFLLIMMGWVLGGALAYMLGRFVGYPLIARIISRERIEELIQMVTSAATFKVALIFRLLMPAESGYIFGLVRYNFWRYAIIMVITEIPFAIFGIWVSDALIDRHFLVFFGGLFGGVAVTICFIWFYRKKLLQQIPEASPSQSNADVSYKRADV